MAQQVGKVTLDVLYTRKREGVSKKSGKPWSGLLVGVLVETERGREPGSFMLFGYEGADLQLGPQSFDFRLGVNYNGDVEFRPVGPSAR